MATEQYWQDQRLFSPLSDVADSARPTVGEAREP